MNTNNIKKGLNHKQIKELDSRMGELEHEVDEMIKTTKHNPTLDHISDQLMSIRMTLRKGEL